MKIYTRGGDGGSTSIMGGRRIEKHNPRIESYGTVDELIAWMGLIRDSSEAVSLRDAIIYIQGELMAAAAALSTDPENPPKEPVLPDEGCVVFMEKMIDRLEEELPALNSFILPGGGTTASWCHIARTVCRRAERRVTALATEADVHQSIVTLLNRLSDLLFVMARYISYKSGKEEVKWVR